MEKDYISIQMAPNTLETSSIILNRDKENIQKWTDKYILVDGIIIYSMELQKILTLMEISNGANGKKEKRYNVAKINKS